MLTLNAKSLFFNLEQKTFTFVFNAAVLYAFQMYLGPLST